MSLTSVDNKLYHIPKNTRVYAIGDIHGHYDALARMHIAIDKHLDKNPIEKAIIVYLGDYIDRGPDSAKVLARMCEMPEEEEGIERVFIKGNHELAFLGFMKDPKSYGKNWMKYGGVQTIESYGVTVPNKEVLLSAEIERISKELNAAVPEQHKEFCINTRLKYVCGDYLFVHAGIRPKVDLSEQTPQDLVFIRHEFLDYDKPHDKFVVHGHSITEVPDIRNNRVGLDTGYWKHGVLTTGIFEGCTIDFLQVKKDA